MKMGELFYVLLKIWRIISSSSRQAHKFRQKKIDFLKFWYKDAQATV